jgi:hypothetical protein
VPLTFSPQQATGGGDADGEISYPNGLEAPRYFVGGLSQCGGQILHPVKWDICGGPGHTDCSDRFVFRVKNWGSNTPQSKLVLFIVERITLFPNPSELTL